MNESREDRIQQIADLIRNQEYQVDPVAVADGLLRRVRWDDVPDLSELTAPVRPRRRVLRVRNLLRPRRPAAVTVRTRPQLSS